MKFIYIGMIATIFLLSSKFTFADSDCFDCRKDLPGMPETTQIDTLASVVDPNINQVVNEICDQFLLFLNTGHGKLSDYFETPILNYLGIADRSIDNRKHITSFWNKYKDDFVCTEERDGFRSPQHLMKRVIDMGTLNAFYFRYLFKDRSVDVNAIEYNSAGEPETVLDYINSILKKEKNSDVNSEISYDYDQIRKLKAFLITVMNAETGKNLNKL